jgi:hypothetical protein
VTLDRRGLLRTALFAAACVPGPPQWVRDAADAAQPSSRLTSAELDDLIAFAELVVEGRPLTRAEREVLVAEMEARGVRDPDSVALYRLTVVLLRNIAGRPFSTLDVPARRALIAKHKLDSSDVRPGEETGPFAEDVTTVRTEALRLLISDYYGSSAGWAVVGYQSFPGRCGDLTRYTRRER